MYPPPHSLSSLKLSIEALHMQGTFTLTQSPRSRSVRESKPAWGCLLKGGILPRGSRASSKKINGPKLPSSCCTPRPSMSTLPRARRGPNSSLWPLEPGGAAARTTRATLRAATRCLPLPADALASGPAPGEHPAGSKNMNSSTRGSSPCIRDLSAVSAHALAVSAAPRALRQPLAAGQEVGTTRSQASGSSRPQQRA